MKFKDFLIKSGGVISSIALACSMFTMAGAVADLSWYCGNCGNLFFRSYGVPTTPTSYQDFFSVDDIEGLSNMDPVSTYLEEPNLTIAEYNELKICISCLKDIIARYNAEKANDLSAPGTSNTPITVTAEASTFDITVPTSIPLVVNADGTVTAPTGVKLVNGSAGSVKVASIAMNNGDWTLTDYNSGNRSKLAEAKVDSKKLGLSLAVTGNAAVTSKDGSQNPAIDTSKWTMAGGSDLPITVGAIATASSAKATSEVTAANVVFTLAWS